VGRNIFQSQAPQAMIAAVNAVVHNKRKAERGLRAVQLAQGEGVTLVVPGRRQRVRP